LAGVCCRVVARIFANLPPAPLAANAEASMSESCFYLLAWTPGVFEMAIVGMVALLLFGTRLPSVMRSLGLGVTEFKKGLKGEGLTDPNTSIEDQRRADEQRVD
jgi:sec-independent protein translocase protein TatA